MRHFSIRDLFWLTLVVAMGVSWWMNPCPDDSTEFELKLAIDSAHVELARLQSALQMAGLKLSGDGFIVRYKPPPPYYPSLK